MKVRLPRTVYCPTAQRVNITVLLGSVHKRRPQSRGICPVRTFFGQGGRGFFKCGRPYFLVQKTSHFGAKNILNLWCVRTDRGRGLSQCRHFAVKGRGGQFFAILCRRRPL